MSRPNSPAALAELMATRESLTLTIEEYQTFNAILIGALAATTSYQDFIDCIEVAKDSTLNSRQHQEVR